MKNTNFQNLRGLLKRYMPKTFGIASVKECNLIKNSLQLEEMDIIDLWNLRDFVVLFFVKESKDKQERMNMDRMSAITAVIDKDALFVDDLLELLGCKIMLGHEISERSGINVARTCAHHQAFCRSETHRGVYALTKLNGSD